MLKNIWQRKSESRYEHYYTEHDCYSAQGSDKLRPGLCFVFPYIIKIFNPSHLISYLI